MKKLSFGIYLFLSTLAYSLVFLIPKLPTSKIIGVFDLETVTLLTACGIFYLLSIRPTPGFQAFSFTTILITFTLPLLRIWQNATSGYFLLLGWLPWSDAKGYYSDANLLIDGRLFGAFSARRPLFPGFLTSILSLTGRDLQLVLIVMTLVAAVAVFWVARQVQNTISPLAGTGIIFLSWFYYRQTLGTTMTEQLGFPLGILAFGILLDGIQAKNKVRFAAGLSVLTFALLARAGAFFVLPSLFLFGLVFFKPEKNTSPRIGLLFFTAILIPFVVNALLGRLVAPPDTIPLGNFSYTLYGQVVGGQGWTQALIDYPELENLDEATRNQEIYRLALEKFRQHPDQLFKAVFKSWADFVIPSQFAAFSFLQSTTNNILNIIIQLLASLLSLAGIWICATRFREPVYGIALAGLAGIIVSIPFIPPQDASLMRVQASTMLWIFLLIGISLAEIDPLRKLTVNRDATFFGPAAVFTISLLLLATVGPILVRFSSHNPLDNSITCQENQVAIRFKIQKNTHVTIQENPGQNFHSIDLNLFKRSLTTFPGVYYEFSNMLTSFQPPFTLLYTQELSTGSNMWIVGPPTLSREEGKNIFACVDITQTPYSVIYIKEFQVLNSK